VIRRALVTGGAGFIGSHVADALIESGAQVEVIDNLSSGKREQVPSGAKLHHLDIESPEAAEVVRRGSFDALFHLAAQIDVRKSVADPAFDSRTNIGGTLNLLEAFRGSNHGGRFIFSSTGGAVYGDLVSPPTGETAPKDPQSPYGTAKLSVEYYLGYYARVHGLEAVALRYSNVYGPRQDPHGDAGVVAIFCGRLLAGSPLTVYGDGRQTRDYVFVGDVARANVLAASAALPPVGAVDSRAFNIGTAVETDVITLGETLQRAAGKTTSITHAPARAGEQQRSAVAIEKAARVLGWRPAVPLSEGLARTYRYFQERQTRVKA